MASASSNSCNSCIRVFNKYYRKSVALPCGHDFCLNCLVSLKTSGVYKCSKCGADWTELEVEVLSEREIVDYPDTCNRKEDQLDGKMKWKGRPELCQKHGFPYQLWCNEDKDFFCIKCVVDNSGKKLELIDEAIPKIRLVLEKKVAEKLQAMELDIDELGKIETDYQIQLITVGSYRKIFLRLERDIQERISYIKHLKKERVNASAVAEEVSGRIGKIKSGLDVSLVVESKATLEKLGQPFEVPLVADSEVLLCNIAQAYMTQSSSKGSSAEAVFIRELQRTSGSSVGPMTEVIRAAENLNGGGQWTVDSGNCLAALLALADKQPGILTLVARHYEPESLPAAVVAAVAKAARNCELHLRFLDSFLKPDHATRTRDLERLKHFTKDASLRITAFYGHLNAAGIAKMPRTIKGLGLAIASAADASAVSDLRPWKGLEVLVVSVGDSVSAQFLKPLPSVPCTYLHFPGLSDARAGSVRPAIEALVPRKEFDFLCLPSCQLTGDGARRLARQLCGIQIKIVFIEPDDAWRLGVEEKESVVAEFLRAADCTVAWDLDWLYRR